METPGFLLSCMTEAPSALGCASVSSSVTDREARRRRRISTALRGRRQSEETKQRIRESLRRRAAQGLPVGMAASPDPTHSEETKRRISQALARRVALGLPVGRPAGTKLSEETKRKIGESLARRAGLGLPVGRPRGERLTEETKRKIGQSLRFRAVTGRPVGRPGTNQGQTSTFPARSTSYEPEKV